jgi:hypothetical protein
VVGAWVCRARLRGRVPTVDDDAALTGYPKLVDALKRLRQQTIPEHVPLGASISV